MIRFLTSTFTRAGIEVILSVRMLYVWSAHRGFAIPTPMREHNRFHQSIKLEKSKERTSGMAKQSTVEIKPAKGKLGIMIPGMGAVATTFVAGVEAVRKGLAKPIGSLTQMGTVRLGKRTE